MRQVVVVTGASSGLGLSITKRLIKNNMTVYATLRNPGKQEDLLHALGDKVNNVHVKVMDVNDSDSVNRCVKEIIASEGHIDYLINNAGMGYVKTTEEATEDEMKQVMNVNFMGVVRTTKAVLPHMRQAEKGHIINISSVGGLVGQPFNEIYCASKFAVEGYTESLATYVGPHFNIHFTVVEPGGIQTAFFQNIEKNEGMPTLKNIEAYAPLLHRYAENFKKRHATATNHDVYQSPEEVAEKVHACMLLDNPPLRLRTSEWSEAFCRLKTEADPTGSVLSKKIYETLL